MIDFSKFKTNKDEMELITKIVKRAVYISVKPLDFMTASMDLEVAHNEIPLNLGGLLKADVTDFGHDVFGIFRHINRTNGKLQRGFVPRFSA